MINYRSVRCQWKTVGRERIKPSRHSIYSEIRDRTRGMPLWMRTFTVILESLCFKRPTNLGDNEIDCRFGIRVSRKPLETTGITRRMPNVTFNRDADVDFKVGRHYEGID